MSSIIRSNSKRQLQKAKPLHMSPMNNRKRTAGRIVQVDSKTGRQIRHNPEG